MTVRNYFLVFLIHVATLINAQSTWFENGATWTHDMQRNYGFGYLESKVIGDTIILGQSCKKIQRKYKIWDWDNVLVDDNVSLPHLFVYANPSGLKTYIYNPVNKNFESLYDFTKVVGDTISYPYPELGSFKTFCPNNFYRITETGVVKINGQNLKYYTIEPTINSNYFMAQRIIEKIGSEYWSFHSEIDEFLCVQANNDMNLNSFFRCYEDSSIDFKSSRMTDPAFVYNGNCYYPETGLGIAEKGKELFSIYPNPSNGVVNISLIDLQDYQLKVYNNIGQIVLTHNIQGRQNQIDLSFLSNGLYTINVGNNYKKLLISK
jgi:Secretion system C-terminal sorting domain